MSPGSIGEFPGASMPFGMIQWSPDTPDRIPGSGYSWDDRRISGFSLTHLSGAGCPVYGDVPVLPAVGALSADPAAASATFRHSSEQAAPGRYSVTLSPGIETQLAVTTRTGISQFTFPDSRSAHILLKVSSSANPVSAAAVHAVGDDEVDGQVTSGGFCGTGTNYTLYFVARFNRPFQSVGTWRDRTVTPTNRDCVGAGCGAWVTFDTTGDRRVDMKVGISYVSAAGAAANLAGEDPGWSLTDVENNGTATWNHLLDRIRVSGGTRAEQQTFETAVYHALLDPTVVSDADGDYVGDDGLVHRDPGHTQYANFSEWDIYRSEVELIALLASRQASDMVQSLVDDAEQGGWLPKWAIADGDAAQMNGDSADPIISAAYAFGARDFDIRAALAAMVKGATEPEPLHGLEIERQYLDQYLTQHYVDASALDLDSINYSAGASMTLEYAIDDFSIAQLAAATGDTGVADTMMARAHNWEYLFNPSTGYIQGRNGDGTFPPGPAFNRKLFDPGGEEGFEEGNAVQYTWAVPQDLAALASLMGGDAAAASELRSVVAKLNAGRFAPYDWSGNEPSLWTPWEFDYFGEPYRTQSTVRRIVTTQYHDAPVNEPGNDDLGAISSWYVWAALGLYPVTPGTANLALASPLFPSETITLPDGHQLVIHAPGASTSTPYVHRLTIIGPTTTPSPATCPPATAPRSPRRAVTCTWNQPWLPASVIRTGATLTFDLSPTPDRAWGAAPSDAPPSYGAGRIPAVGYSTPSGTVSLPDGTSTTLTLGIRWIDAGGPPVAWTATASPGVTIDPTSGVLVPSGARVARDGTATGEAPSPAATTIRMSATSPGSGTVDVVLRTADGTELPPVVVSVDVTR